MNAALRQVAEFLGFMREEILLSGLRHNMKELRRELTEIQEAFSKLKKARRN